MKIWDILQEDVQNQLEEGWRENILATVMGVASLFGNVKGQNGGNAPVPTPVSVNQTVSDGTFKLDISKLFASGRYRFNDNEVGVLKDALRKLGTEIRNNRDSNFILQVVSSESKVTNYDAEVGSPTYKQKLEVGELAKKRAATLQFIISKFFDQLKADGIFNGAVEFVEPKILIGDQPWPSVNPDNNSQRTKDDSMYTKDQYTFVNVKIVKPKNSSNVNYNPYAAYAEMGEARYTNNRLVGMSFVPSRKSDDITQGGGLNTAYQNILFRTVKPNTQLTGKRDEKGVYVNDYLIPSEWWNSHITTTHITPEDLNYITTHFAVK